MNVDEETNLIEENIRVRRYDVDHNFIGWRLDQFLANRIEGMSRSLAGRVACSGTVEVLPERKVKAGTKLRLDDVVIIREELEPEVVQDEEASILFEDAAVVIVDKPSGMLVHETATVRLNTITFYFKRLGWEGAEPAHRLDRETSGALVCARTSDFVAPLRELFASDDPQKVYRALVVDPDNTWEVGEKRVLDSPLGFDEASSLPMRVWHGDLHARTHVKVLGRQSHPMGDLADLEVRIETGRQHQIRVHLAMEGTPIAGDKLYGRSDDFFKATCDFPDDQELLAQLHFPRHALHAWRIEIGHPVTGERLRVEAPLPEIWRCEK